MSDIPSWISSMAAVVAVSISVRGFFKNGLFSVLVSGIVIVGISVEVLVGHLVHVESMYRWFGDQPRMSAEAAILFGIIGAGKITISAKLRHLIAHAHDA